MAKKKDREWKGGKGIKGTVRAAITHHPDKFDADCKDPDRLCPYAIFSAMKKRGMKPHYKDQKSTLKGEPKKKAKFKDEDKKEHAYYSFTDYVTFIEAKEPGTFIFWGQMPTKAKYSGKVGGAMWDQFVLNATKGYGRCYLIDASSIQEAKGMIEQAAPSFLPNVFILGDQANAAIARFNKPSGFREEEDKESLLAKVAKGSPQFPPGTKMARRGNCPDCDAPVRPDTGEQMHSVDCPHHGEWVRRRHAARRARGG